MRRSHDAAAAAAGERKVEVVVGEERYPGAAEPESRRGRREIWIRYGSPSRCVTRRDLVALMAETLECTLGSRSNNSAIVWRRILGVEDSLLM